MTEAREYFEFDVVKEHWNKYRLGDGSLLKLKLVLKKLFEIPITDTEKQLAIDFQKVVALGYIPPQHRGEPSTDVITPEMIKEHIIENHMDFETESEHWNEYQLTDGRRLRIKWSLRSVHKTDLFDQQHGEPVYSVDGSIEMLGLPPR